LRKCMAKVLERSEKFLQRIEGTRSVTEMRSQDYFTPIARCVGRKSLARISRAGRKCLQRPKRTVA